MHDAERVRGRERAAHLVDDLGDVGEGERAVGDAVGQRAAAQQTEDEERTAGPAPIVVERDDVRVLDPRHELRFGLEPLHEARIVGELGAHDLHGDLASDARLHRAVHRTERALADDFAELVARDRDTPTWARATDRRA